LEWNRTNTLSVIVYYSKNRKSGETVSGREKALAVCFHSQSPAEPCRGQSFEHQETPSQTVNSEAQRRLERLLEDAIKARQRALERFETQQSERAA
jgi:hypothetical protein